MDSKKALLDAVKAMAASLNETGSEELARMMLGKVPATKLTGNSFDKIWIDELHDGELTMAAKPISQDVVDRLNELAGRMTDYFSKNAESVRLLSPANLTVTIAGKGFSKANHIGGETFRPERVYVGSAKAGSRLIFVFKPEAASAYSHMEMSEADAQNLLENFRNVANFAAGGNFAAELAAIRNMENKAREEKAAVAKMAEYPEFGAW